MSMFINREEEKRTLQEIYSSKKAELVLLYGRRRVGKSSLLVESIKEKNAIYFLADASDNILEILSRQVQEEFAKFSTWDDFFDFVLRSKYEIFIIDEFQYLVQVDKSWPTILQRWWEKLKDSHKKIILCGSILSAIYKITRGYGSALYGRKTREINILPLKFKHTSKMLPNYSTEDLVRAYCLLGGIPRYIEEFDSKKPLEDNLREKVFEKTCFLYNEPINLLTEEFRDFSSYLSILLAISEGKTKFNEISDYSHISTNKLSKYLSVLERVEITQKEIPITEGKIKSKTTRYFIKDNFYSFWLGFVMKSKVQIEQGLKNQVLESTLPLLNGYYGKTFEYLCREMMLDKISGITKIGRWWYHDNEIDILALDDKRDIMYSAECKWKEDVNAKTVLKEMQEKTKLVRWKEGRRKEKYVIFARSFSEKTDEALLIDMKSIQDYLDS